MRVFTGAALCAVLVSLIGGSAVASSSDDWLGYNGSYAGDRYSTLSQINNGNVAQLHPVCAFQFGELGPAQTAPTVAGGVIYLTDDESTYALDAKTCMLRWKNTYTDAGVKAGLANRGVALLDGKLFRGTPDSHLIAIDAATGKTLWDSVVSDSSDGSNTAAAPLAWQGKVFIGIAGSEDGVKGRIMAFSAEDGKPLWTFSTVATGNDPGASTWGDASTTATGGGGTWSSFGLDPQTGTLFVPVGNPGPDFSADYRPGANLYTSSIVALDANTGKLRWYYQLVPHDYHDWDAAAPPALFTAADGKPMLAFAGKSGILFTMNYATHKIVAKTPVTTISNADAPFTQEGTHFCPGTLGGVEWNGPAYSSTSKLVYVNAVDWCSVVKLGEVRYLRGKQFLGSGNGMGVKDASGGTGWLTAVDPLTGNVAWKYHSPSLMVAAVTATAGGLVFTGELNGAFDAFDAAGGKLLYTFNTGGSVAGGIATYMVDRKQYVAVMSGNQSRTSVKGGGSPTLFVFGL
jgi:alcohol dehydrogenase (cytochrome c)